MVGIKSEREKEKVSCRREGVEEHGWELLIGSREFSRVVFCYLLIETDIHFGGGFFVCDGSTTHGIGVSCLDKAVIVGGYVFLLIMTIGMDVSWGMGRPLVSFVSVCENPSS